MTGFSYRSFCWVIGTTSFRTSELNYKIEKQLILLNQFCEQYSKSNTWNWNSDVQTQYYDYLKANGFVVGDAKRKDKDAREKTSGLVDIGLLTKDRKLTPVGKELLDTTVPSHQHDDNVFKIDLDSFIYLKQLLKTVLVISNKPVRPFIVLIKALIELEYLSYEEFTYFIPLIEDEESCKNIISLIRKYRDREVTMETIVYDKISKMENYIAALDLFMKNKVNESLICNIGMNRKSRQYDAVYFTLYTSIKKVFLDKQADNETIDKLRNIVKSLHSNSKRYWGKLLFGDTFSKKVALLSSDCSFHECTDENALKKEFFKYMHVYKAAATMADYFDLNRRYFNLTDCVIFDNQQICLDIIPRYLFREIIDELYDQCFTFCGLLTQSVELTSISKAFDVDITSIYHMVQQDYRISHDDTANIKEILNNVRLKRFKELIEKRFTQDVLIELLNCFETRNDARIRELVTDDALVPTIFEYITAIIWYKISNYEGNILQYMRLSLDANLLPKTHAAGGGADIVYKYNQNTAYPAHTLLIEATLNDENSQRKAEMEPVSRHLGSYLIDNSSEIAYTLFVSTVIDRNLYYDFASRKYVPYTKDGVIITGLKILMLCTDDLKKILRQNIKYPTIYKVFEEYYNKKTVLNYVQSDMVESILR